jgi:hypothetical protein
VLPHPIIIIAVDSKKKILATGAKVWFSVGENMKGSIKLRDDSVAWEVDTSTTEM